MSRLLVALLISTAAVASVPASATTYVGSHAVDGGSIDLSITTDNTLGVLTGANITGWSFLMTNAGGSASLTTANSLQTYFSGNALSASASELVFDFSAIGHMQWDNFGSAGDDAYCLDSPGAAFTCIGAPPSEVMVVNGAFSIAERSGRFVHGTAVDNAGVPEPSTWAMMLAGFAAIGFAMRRQRQHAQVRFAF
jgi:hypothetical protein